MKEPISTCDLLDANESVAQAVSPGLRHFGGLTAFCGEIETVRVFEDNVLVKATLTEPGDGRVLVVDGGGSLRCALMGDMLGDLALANHWTGVVVHGCIRDSVALSMLALGVMALASFPRKSVKRGEGQRGERIAFMGANFQPGNWLYADADGVIVTPQDIRGPVA